VERNGTYVRQHVLHAPSFLHVHMLFLVFQNFKLNDAFCRCLLPSFFNFAANGYGYAHRLYHLRLWEGVHENLQEYTKINYRRDAISSRAHLNPPFFLLVFRKPNTKKNVLKDCGSSWEWPNAPFWNWVILESQALKGHVRGM
jgi:hypothetical protein